MAAAAVLVKGERDPVALLAAQILVGLRSRKLRGRPEWLPPPAGEAFSSPSTAPAEEEPERWAGRRPRSRGRRGSLIRWTRALREPDLAGSGGKEERDAGPAPRPVEEATLFHGAAAGSGPPSTISAGCAPRTRHADEKAAALAAPPAKGAMKASSPDTPLDYGAGGSRASSSGDDAARTRARREGPGARRSGGGDDEGCSSPAKRPRVAADEDKPILLPTEQSMQSETRASSTKGLAFDLNLPPPDDSACPDG